MSRLKNYELITISKPNDEKLYERAVAKVKKLITGNGGTITNVQRWGKQRKLAYEIAGFQEGVYTIFNFLATNKCVKIADQAIRIDEDIIRHLCFAKVTY